MEENIALARRFLQEQFVSRGMICDFAVHLPDPKGGIPNPHFHVLCPIRPINPDGAWGNKQRREYTLNKKDQRMRDDHGNLIWKSVPTTDWGQKETLLHWRQEWANYVNRELEKKAPLRKLIIVPIKNREHTNCPLSTKARQYAPWRRKVSALKKEA